MFNCCNILRFRLQNYCFFCIYTNILEEKSLNEGDFYEKPSLNKGLQQRVCIALVQNPVIHLSRVTAYCMYICAGPNNI